MKRFITPMIFVLLSCFYLPQAQADTVLSWMEHGKDRVYAYPKRIVVEDNECDKHPVRAFYTKQNRHGRVVGPYSFEDRDGCGGDWWQWDYRGTRWHIHSFTIKERKNGLWYGPEYRVIQDVA